MTKLNGGLVPIIGCPRRLWQGPTLWQCSQWSASILGIMGYCMPVAVLYAICHLRCPTCFVFNLATHFTFHKASPLYKRYNLCHWVRFLMVPEIPPKIYLDALHQELSDLRACKYFWMTPLSAASMHNVVHITRKMIFNGKLLHRKDLSFWNGVEK